MTEVGNLRMLKILTTKGLRYLLRQAQELGDVQAVRLYSTELLKRGFQVPKFEKPKKREPDGYEKE